MMVSPVRTREGEHGALPSVSPPVNDNIDGWAGVFEVMSPLQGYVHAAELPENFNCNQRGCIDFYFTYGCCKQFQCAVRGLGRIQVLRAWLEFLHPVRGIDWVLQTQRRRVSSLERVQLVCTLRQADGVDEGWKHASEFRQVGAGYLRQHGRRNSGFEIEVPYRFVFQTLYAWTENVGSECTYFRRMRGSLGSTSRKNVSGALMVYSEITKAFRDEFRWVKHANKEQFGPYRVFLGR